MVYAWIRNRLSDPGDRLCDSAAAQWQHYSSGGHRKRIWRKSRVCGIGTVFHRNLHQCDRTGSLKLCAPDGHFPYEFSDGCNFIHYSHGGLCGLRRSLGSRYGRRGEINPALRRFHSGTGNRIDEQPRTDGTDRTASDHAGRNRCGKSGRSCNCRRGIRALLKSLLQRISKRHGLRPVTASGSSGNPDLRPGNLVGKE